MEKKDKIKKSAKKFWHIYWNSLHYLSYLYPENPTENQKKQIYFLIEKMRKDGILCNKCKSHFIKWTNKYKIEDNYNNRNELILYFVNLHNDVNLRNKKPLFYKAKVDEIYLNFDDKNLIDYKLDIKKLFTKGEIFKFPDIINSFTRQKILKEFDLIDFA